MPVFVCMDSLVAVQSLILHLAITANGEVDDMVKNYRKNYHSNRSRMALKITFSMPPYPGYPKASLPARLIPMTCDWGEAASCWSRAAYGNFDSFPCIYFSIYVWNLHPKSQCNALQPGDFYIWVRVVLQAPVNHSKNG